MPSASDYKDREFERQKMDYLSLKDSKDQQAIKAFNHFFDADRFRHDYWIHLVSGTTNGFWWTGLEDSPESLGYTTYMLPLSSVPSHRASVYHLRPHLPTTKQSVLGDLNVGYADLLDDQPVVELADVSAVIASRQGRAPEGALFMTLIVELQEEQFAIAVMTDAEHRAKVIDHLNKLLQTRKSANQPVEATADPPSG